MVVVCLSLLEHTFNDIDRQKNRGTSSALLILFSLSPFDFHYPLSCQKSVNMYTSTIIGSYNTIAANEHHGFVIKPPIKKQPRKTGSKDLPSVPQAQRSTSEDSSNFVGINLPPDALPHLSGLQMLAAVDSVDINPDKSRYA